MRSRNNILEQFKEYDALQKGHFLLSSGKHSSHYLQVAKITQYPAILQEFLEDWFVDLTEFESVETVLTAAIGGITIGQQTGLMLNTRAIFAERNDANDLELKRGFSLSDGEPILLVEDVMTTGGTLEELQGLAQKNNAEIQGIATIVNRSGTNTLNGFPVHSLLEVDLPVYESDQCPLCDDEIPINRPGTKKVDV